MSMEQRFPTSDRQLEEHDLERYSRKRRAPAPTTGEDLYPVQGIQGNMPRLKRVRVNWTSEENDVFFDTVRRNSTMDEQSIIRAIVASLGGKRNWTQCKGHFRNLVFVKKITLDEKSKRWSVDPNAKRPSRDTASSTRNSDQSLSESDAQPGEKVENTKGRPLKKNPSSQQEEVQDIDRDEDEDEDIVEVEDVELGGGEDEADDNYVDQDDEDHSEIRKVNKPKVSENESGTKKRKIRDTQVQSGTNGVGQGRTVPTNRDTTPSERSPRAMNNDRRGSEVEDGPRTMPHKKQLNVPKLESISRLYSSPPRKAKDPKRRNTADYRPTGYAEGRRYLKQ